MSSASTSARVLRHIVLFKLTPTALESDIDAAVSLMRSFPSTIPDTILSVNVGRHTGPLFEGYVNRNQGHELILEVTVKDAKALETYNFSAPHQKLIKEYLPQIRGDNIPCVVDYWIDPKTV